MCTLPIYKRDSVLVLYFFYTSHRATQHRPTHTLTHIFVQYICAAISSVRRRRCDTPTQTPMLFFSLFLFILYVNVYRCLVVRAHFFLYWDACKKYFSHRQWVWSTRHCIFISAAVLGSAHTYTHSHTQHSTYVCSKSFVIFTIFRNASAEPWSCQ